MKVEELIIDGFKSYATRTVISQWDAQFNCITGLNGSGKSNILDAICFVLGITTMSTVRAQNLQDLIYKRGQAGVTKASVTIVFDNSDKAKSPLGFEDQAQISVTRQIVLGGQSKFLINGHRAQQQSVQQLFQSVQLNINNPNFLIMQGRITKVLNMKPEEILSLIEEAAGTRMFEERREKALKTMAKKEKKVEEIHELLREEIEPKLANLRDEKRTFLEFQQTQVSLDRVEKLVVAHDYVSLTQKQLAQSQGLDDMKIRFEELTTVTDKCQHEITNLEQDLAELRQRREIQLQKGGRFQSLELKVKQVSQEVARLKTFLELKTANISEENAENGQLQSQIVRLEQECADKRSNFEGLQKTYNDAKQKLDDINKDIAKNSELLQSLMTGVSKSGSHGGYANQLQEAQQQLNAAQTSSAQAKVRINYLEKLNIEDMPKLTKAETQIEALKAQLEAKDKESADLGEKLSSAGWQPDRLDHLKSRETELGGEVRRLVAEIDRLRKTSSNLEFSYSRPSADFNPSSVKGLVAHLFSVPKQNQKATTALQVCGGGRLYNVVVDSDTTAAQLLQKGQLRKRVTMLPLNKISSRRLPAEKINSADQIAPGRVNLALDLIKYDAENLAALQYVFGSTLICKDDDSAKMVTFDPKVRTKSVTLEGDVYDPLGTLSGGSSNQNSSSTLLLFQKYNELNGQLKAKKQELADVQHEIRLEEQLLVKFGPIKKAMDLAEHELELIKRALESGTSAAFLAKYQERVNEIEQLQSQMLRDEEVISKSQIKIKQIEKDMAEFKSDKGGKLNELRAQIQALKTAGQAQSAAVKEHLRKFQNGQVEFEHAKNELQACRDQISEKAAGIADLKKSLETIKIQYERSRITETEAQDALEVERKTLIGIDDEVGTLESLIAGKKKFMTDSKLEAQKLKHELEKSKSTVDSVVGHIKSLEAEFEWVVDQAQYFGQSGTQYDYHSTDMGEARANLKRLRERIKGMKKHVNPKVMNMIENVEKKEESLRGMIQTIERDKKKIEETIVSLDDYKRKALIETWENVSIDFGKIFSDLLPKSFAKLVPPEGKDVTEGLEVKVALGGVWKDGLAELSGGQRSLIALSLILALLQYKPAPMYILDEVDAALDLHHTQNIGHIIKTRFQDSQFIVVSLKEGMFTNANRVFRARFQDGTSTIIPKIGDR